MDFFSSLHFVMLFDPIFQGLAISMMFGALAATFHEIVSGVALNDSRRVRAAIESLHGAFAKTQDALYHGEAELRKNPQDAKVFERMDRDFHKDLEALSQAAEKVHLLCCLRRSSLRRT